MATNEKVGYMKTVVTDWTEGELIFLGCPLWS